MRILTGLFACFLLTSPSFAYSETQCGGIGNVYDTYECLDSENKMLARRLNQLYGEIQELKIDPDFKTYVPTDDIPRKLFTASQIKWNEYIEANCDMHQVLSATTQGAGSGLTAKECYNNAYHQRVNEIELWLNDFKEIYQVKQHQS